MRAFRFVAAFVTIVTLLLMLEQLSRTVPVERLTCQLARAASLPCYNEQEGLLSPQPLHLFSLYAKELRVRDLARLQQWLAVGVDSTDSSGATPLHYAAHAGNCWAVQLLLAREADALLRDRFNHTPRDLLNRNRANILTRLVCVKLLVLREQQSRLNMQEQLEHPLNVGDIQFQPVPRVELAAVDVAQFHQKYSGGQAVVLTNSLRSFNLASWSPADVANDCGQQLFNFHRYSARSTKWAKIEKDGRGTVAEFISKANLFAPKHQNQSTAQRESLLRIFDQRVLGRCPKLSAQLTLPSLFAMDLRRCYKSYPGHNDFPAQPSLFVDPAGVKSGLHIDSGGTAFMLLVLSGSKTVRLVHRSAEHLLRGDELHDQNQLNFLVDLFEPAQYSHSHPGLSLLSGKVWETTLTAGDSLYVPAGTAHQVVTDRDTIALGLNFVDLENLPVTLLYCGEDAHPSHLLSTACARVLAPLAKLDLPTRRALGDRYMDVLLQNDSSEYHNSNSSGGGGGGSSIGTSSAATRALPISKWTSQCAVAEKVLGIQSIVGATAKKSREDEGLASALSELRDHVRLEWGDALEN